MKYIFWMCGTLISFCCIAISVREISNNIDTFQMLFVRSVISLLVVLLLLSWQKKFSQITTTHFKLHVLRNAFHFIGQYAWFVGLTLLPLAEVFALEFTVPIWAAILASVFLQEKLTLKKVAAISLASFGVLVIVQPGFEEINSATYIVLGSAICFAIAHTFTKHLAKTDSPLIILFYMSVMQLPIGLILCLDSWVWPNAIQWLWLIVIGITSMSAHYCLAKAMQLTEMTKIMIIDFLRLPIIGLIGVVLYQESFTLALLTGGLLMLLGNITMIYKGSFQPRFSLIKKKQP